jgi:putative transcriptional regulator
MIEFKLNEMLESHGKSAYWLARETGISESVLWRMRHGKTGGIQFDTLERICRALECQPGDMLVIVDDKREAKRKAKTK